MATPYSTELTFLGNKNPADVSLLAMALTGGISAIPTAMLEVVARDKAMDLGKVVGTQIVLTVTGEAGEAQRFTGTCISAEALGITKAQGRYLFEVRPWIWFLTRSRNNRIFQNMKTTDIVKDVLGDHGFSGDLVLKHTKAEVARDYCTQYRETDYDFVVRLLAEEGIYFYFDHQQSAVKMVLADQVDTHDVPGAHDKLPFREQVGLGRIAHVASWQGVERTVTDKVTLRDYDFTKPSADLTATSLIKSNGSGHKPRESYQYPGGYKVVADGEGKAAALIEAEAAGHQTWRGTGNALNLSPGKLFELTDHPRHAAGSVFLVTQMTQIFRLDPDPAATEGSVLLRDHGTDMDPKAHVATRFEAVAKSKPFRMPMTPPRPQIAGVQTARVTCAAGEEITVDEYGRIRVQFHWDRDGKNDDKSSCWVRTMMPWTGKNWGMVAFPRTGQEVVIQFEEGDPDRPLCVGMLYNADTMPPYDLPGQATRSGIKTNSSKGGGGYNELMFEDKAGEELLRIGAEKDLVQTVQNAAHIKVGYPQEKDVKTAAAKDKQSMKLEVKKHLDEIVETGNHSFDVQAGSQDIKIKKDKTETIEGKSDRTVTENVTVLIKSGNLSETLNAGNVLRDLKKGNETHKLSAGNFSVSATAGKIEMTAAQSITLKVGGSSIKIDQTGVTIAAPMVKIDAKAMLEAKSPVTQVKGTATLILKGGMTMIN